MKSTIFLVSLLFLSTCNSKKQDETIQPEYAPQLKLEGQQQYMDDKGASDIDISMFPKSKEGMVRYQIDMAKEKNEDDFMIQLHIGKEMEIDCNRHWLMGALKTMTVEGWGYNYYEFTSGEVGATLMGCLDEDKRKEFVKFDSGSMHYNSKLPLMVYVPEDLEVRYSIWQRQEKSLKAKK